MSYKKNNFIKISSLVVLLFSSLYAYSNYDLINNAYKNKKNSLNNNTAFVKNKSDNFVWNKKFIENKLEDFPFLMGVSDKEFKDLVNRYINDSFWMKANEWFYDKRKWKKYGKASIPRINKVLKYLDLSTKNGNVLAAFQGSILIKRIFSGYIPIIPKYILKQIVKSKEIKIYYKDFIDLLLRHNYCFAYSEALKYYAYVDNNIDKAYKIGLNGIKVCRNQLNNKKIPRWMDVAMRSDFVKFKTDFNLYQNEKYKESIEKNRNLK